MDQSQIDKLRDSVGSLFAQDALARDRATRWGRGLLMVGGAFLAGLSQLTQTPSGGFSQVVGWSGALLALIGGTWAIFAEETAPSALETSREALDAAQKALFAARESESTLFELDMNNQWLSELFATFKALRDAIESVIRSDTIGDSELQKILNSVSRNLAGLSGFEAGEFWTLAILRHDSETGQLVCAAHQRSDQSDGVTAHRSWGPGEGVVGQAFLTQREIVVADVMDKEAAGWLHIPNKKDKDDQRYRSMVAVPIRVPTGEKTWVVWGVAVATSDRPHQFTVDVNGIGGREAEPARLLAGMVGLAIAPHYPHKGRPEQPADSHLQGQDGNVVESESRDEGNHDTV